MISPLKKINIVLSQIAKGDLSRELTVASDDEFGELSKNVNIVVADLRKLIGNISENTHVLNDAAEQSNQRIEEVTDSLAIQKQTIEQVAVQTSELGQSADHILSKANNAEEDMTNALQQSNALEKTAKTTNERMQNLALMLDRTTDVMSVLQQESANISSILDTIHSISDQTNLLALNAAIEAARAGNAGWGFAVVADEVRTLASKTQQSTGDINVMIEKLRSGVDRAVNSMNESQAKAVSTVEYASKSEGNIRQISGSLLSISDRILQVASAIEEQTSVIKNINENLSNAKHLSDQGMQSASSIRQAVDGLNHQASSLRDEVSSFTL